VAAGILPAVEPGVSPGGMGCVIAKAIGKSRPSPGGRMPSSTAGVDARRYYQRALSIFQTRSYVGACFP